MSPAFRLRRHRRLKANECGSLRRISLPDSGGRTLHSKGTGVARYLALFLLVGLISSCRPRVTGGVIRSEPISLSSDWLTIPLSEPLTAKWEVQLVEVEVSSSFQVSYNPLGIRLDDGSIVVPEAELVSQAGKTQPLPLVGLIGGKELQFGSNKIARGTSFSELRIRSPISLVSSRISWLSYMPQDSQYGKHL